VRYKSRVREPLEIVEVVLARAWGRESPWHGEEHWRCVATTGIELAVATPGADPALAFLFGLLHDTRRENEQSDPGHGARAAAFARELQSEGALGGLDSAVLERLARAIELHSDGMVDDDPAIAVCWDADRLHLPRVGIEPDPERYSTPFARTEEWRDLAAAVRAAPPDWLEVGTLLDAAETRGPIAQSYRVTERLYAGGYPGPFSELEGLEKLAALGGVDVFVDLTGPDDGLRPYAESLRGGARRVAFPVPDFSVPSRERLVEILDTVDSELDAGSTVYVHCWGGIGRTGTVIGCWLVRHGASGEEALERLAVLHGPTPSGWRRSPETDEQRETVLGWRPGD
jgi:hypothetical protein